MSTRFQVEVSKALNALVPLAPLADVLVIRQIAHKRHLRHLPADIGTWLAVTTHIRHNHTDYDVLLDDGYDSDSARHFVLDDMNDVLRSWGGTRTIDANDVTDSEPTTRRRPTISDDDDEAPSDEPE